MTGAAQSVPGARVAIPATALAGALDKVIKLTQHSGPVALGFLDLALDLHTPQQIVGNIECELAVAWGIDADVLRLSAQGHATSPGGQSHGVKLVTTITPSVSAGVIACQTWQLDRPEHVHRRRGGTRVRPVQIYVRLRRMQQARPIGRIPAIQNGKFTSLQA